MHSIVERIIVNDDDIEIECKCGISMKQKYVGLPQTEKEKMLKSFERNGGQNVLGDFFAASLKRC